MHYSLAQLQDSTKLLNNLTFDGGLRQYTLMEFNDPTIGPLRITCSASEFVDNIANLYVYGGGDCPELSMNGLLQALEHSPPGSLFVVATDASAKDYATSATEKIFPLLDSLKAKVIFLITGLCSGENDADFLIYRNISSASSGHVLQNLYYPDYNKVVDFLEFMLWIQKNSTTKLLSEDTDASNYSTSFQVNRDFSALILSTSGTISSLQITGPSGVYPKVTKIVDQAWGSLQTIENPERGVWTIIANASGFFSIRVEGYKASGSLSTGNCSTCHSDATCKKDIFSTRCVCNDGYVGDGHTCSDYDECSDYSGGIRLPESCPSTYSCRTYSPMWLSGSHPQPADGIVDRTACANWEGNCCYWTSNVQIKACAGGYHVYKLSGTPNCNLAYCTDPNTATDSCSCGDDEECKFVDGHFGCHCKSNVGPSELQNLRPDLTCGANTITASFKRCQLEKFSLRKDTIHLTDNSCVGSPDYNTTNLISIMTLPKRGVCGNEIVKSETQVTYKNTIYLSLDTSTSIGGEDYVSILLSCVYPLDMVVSLETALNLLHGSVTINIEGTGQLLATIALYRDASYYTPYEGSEVILTSKSVLYIGVMLNGGDTDQFVLVMKNCYATPSRSASDSRRYYLIRDSCPSRQDSSIYVYENGVSRRGQFSVQLYKYIVDINVVFIHCELRVCDQTTESCTPSCSGLRSTGVRSQETTASVVVGPVLNQADPSGGSSSNHGARACVDLLTSAVLLLAGILLTDFIK
uniref:ZP domain-containing protein n=1 Tax=Leptobrachium leishanense TaxID=445787 RepID=A0A8C5Q5R7_9ANUR